MFGRKTWEKRFRDVGRELIKAAVAVNGLRVMEELPVTGISFDIKNPRAEAWIKRKVFEFAYKVNETTEKDLRLALVDALDEGATIKEITGEVERIFGYAEGYRNEMIARTETISATNYGSREAIEQSGLKTRKEWLETFDERTRESHRPQSEGGIGGEIVPFDEPYSNGLMFPGDPAGEAEEIINCRCTEIYHFEDEE